MAEFSSLTQNTHVKNDENIERFPYRILNDLSSKLKVAEATMMKMFAEREALENFKNEEIYKLKQQISHLVYESNRYHLSKSYCTVCTSDVEFSDASLSDEVSIKASTPVTTYLSCHIETKYLASPVLKCLEFWRPHFVKHSPDSDALFSCEGEADQHCCEEKGQGLHQQDGEDPRQAGDQVPGSWAQEKEEAVREEAEEKLHNFKGACLYLPWSRNSRTWRRGCSRSLPPG